MRTKYRQWAVDYLGEHPEVVLEKIDFSKKFFTEKPLRVEIGSGKGDFIVTMAKNHPNVHYLAVEKVRTVAGILAKKVVDEQIDNVRVFPNDIAIIFEEMGDESVDEIYLNFVDPWPKKRHAKRRLTFQTFLEQYYRILKNGGKLIFKSDNDGLFTYSVEEFQNSRFSLVTHEESYEFDEKNDAMSEYEKKFRDKGQSIHRIIAIKQRYKDGRTRN